MNEIIAQNQIFLGLIGATLTGGLMFLARKIPQTIWKFLIERFTITLIVDNDHEPFSYINNWLGKHASTKKARRVIMEESFDYDNMKWKWGFTLGAGWHFIKYENTFMFIHRHIQDAAALDKLVGQQTRQRLTIHSLGKKQTGLRSLMEAAEKSYLGTDMVKVFIWGKYGYMLADTKTKRSIDTVFIPQEQKDRIVGDLRWFLDNKQFYTERGIPYRRGMMLEGPPGTGKSTMVFVIAGILNKHIYCINLNTVESDNDLMRAFNGAGPDSIIVIEDIDTCDITNERNNKTTKKTITPKTPTDPFAKKEENKITLSGLLNAIDGVVSRDGRILIMTSNHPDKLDEALIRPGRVDIKEHIGLMDYNEAWKMFKTFYKDGTVGNFNDLIKDKLPIAPSALQNILIGDYMQQRTLVPPTVFEKAA